jgi:hypothetical protein
MIGNHIHSVMNPVPTLEEEEGDDSYILLHQHADWIFIMLVHCNNSAQVDWVTPHEYIQIIITSS